MHGRSLLAAVPPDWRSLIKLINDDIIARSDGERTSLTVIVNVGKEVAVSGTKTLERRNGLSRPSRERRMERTHNPDLNPTSPVVEVSARDLQGCRKLDWVTVWFFGWNSLLSG